MIRLTQSSIKPIHGGVFKMYVFENSVNLQCSLLSRLQLQTWLGQSEFRNETILIINHILKHTCILLYIWKDFYSTPETLNCFRRFHLMASLWSISVQSSSTTAAAMFGQISSDLRMCEQARWKRPTKMKEAEIEIALLKFILEILSYNNNSNIMTNHEWTLSSTIHPEIGNITVRVFEIQISRSVVA